MKRTKTQQIARLARAWTPQVDSIVLRPAADALTDVRPLLAHIVEAVGTNAAGRLLGPIGRRYRAGASARTISRRILGKSL